MGRPEDYVHKADCILREVEQGSWAEATQEALMAAKVYADLANAAAAREQAIATMHVVKAIAALSNQVSLELATLNRSVVRLAGGRFDQPR